jgi:GNAT superfamily N-acetyltransferase
VNARVRLAGPDDAEALVRLLGEFRTRFMGRSEPDDEELLASVEQLIRDSNTEYLLAEDAGVAQLRFRHNLWTSAGDCWLEDLYVRDEARRQGLGAALLEASIERALARGCARIELDTQEGYREAMSLYERFGFKRPGLMLRRELEPGA